MNEIETHILEMIGENIESPDVFTESNIGQIRESVNDAIEEISMAMGTEKRIYKIAQRANANIYTLDIKEGDIAWITDVWLTGRSKRLEFYDFNKLIAENPRWLFNSNNPEGYFVIGYKYFGVYPKISSSTDLLEINAVIIPDRYSSDEDRVKLREEFKWAAVHYAVGEYYASRGDAKRATDNHKIYLSKIGMDELYQETAERVWGQSTLKAEKKFTGIPVRPSYQYN